MSEQKAEQKPQGKVKLTISQILKDLSEGITRKEIGEKYGLRPFEVATLFKDPRLKGQRVATKVNFELVEEEGEVAQEEVKAKTEAKPKAEKAAPVAEAASPSPAVATTQAETPAPTVAAEASLASSVAAAQEEVAETAAEQPAGEALKEVASQDDDEVTSDAGQW